MEMSVPRCSSTSVSYTHLDVYKRQYEEFELGAETLREFCLLRAESIGYQLAGEDVTVDASGLDISAMGSMNNTAGGGGKGFRG